MWLQGALGTLPVTNVGLGINKNNPLMLHLAVYSFLSRSWIKPSSLQILQLRFPLEDKGRLHILASSAWIQPTLLFHIVSVLCIFSANRKLKWSRSCKQSRVVDVFAYGHIVGSSDASTVASALEMRSYIVTRILGLINLFTPLTALTSFLGMKANVLLFNLRFDEHKMNQIQSNSIRKQASSSLVSETVQSKRSPNNKTWTALVCPKEALCVWSGQFWRIDFFFFTMNVTSLKNYHLKEKAI